MIPDEVVERVREAADIVEVIADHVKLRRAGVDFRGPCPFHGGKNPNFAVSPRKGIYHCYKCGVSGDVFSFLREHVGLGFADAVRELGERYGVAVPEVAARARVRDDREPLWEALGAAAELFARTLWEDLAGDAARDYLKQRGITRETAERFGMGFSPRDGAQLRGRLHALGFDDQRQVEAGLLVHREGVAEPRPRFFGRLMFPIADPGGHLVGFGGRVIGAGDPKYLNSAESRVFSKGSLLYNLHQAKQSIRKEERALIVEGYFDVVRLAAAGIGSAVAPLGTALAEGQATLLARYTKNVFLLYDSDEAGLKATFRSGLELLRHGVAVRVVTLPAGEDPDSFVLKHGAERLEKQLAAAIDLFERQVQILERRGYFADLHRKRRAVDRLLPTIRAAADPLTRDLYLARLSEVAGIDRETLLREVEANRGPLRGSGRVGGRATASPGSTERSTRHGAPRPGEIAGRGAERSLVLAMVHQVQPLEQLVAVIKPEWFRDPIYAEILAALTERSDYAGVDDLVSGLGPDAVREVQNLMAAAAELSDAKFVIRDSLAQLRERELRDQLAAIDTMMKTAQDERHATLVLEKARLRDELKDVGGRGHKLFRRLESDL